MQYSSAQQIFEEIASVTPSYAGITYRRIEKEGLQWPCPTHDTKETKFLHRTDFRAVAVFSMPLILLRRPSCLMPIFPLILSTGRVLYHYHTGTMTRRAQVQRTLSGKVWWR